MFGVVQFAFFPFGNIQGTAFSGQVWFDQCQAKTEWEDYIVEPAGQSRCQNAT